MDAGLLDVLHDAADEHLRSITDRVDVDLDRVLDEAIDQHRVGRVKPGGLLHVGDEHRLLVDDLHAAPAQHVRRAYDDRIAQRLRDLTRLGQG